MITFFHPFIHFSGRNCCSAAGSQSQRIAKVHKCQLLWFQCDSRAFSPMTVFNFIWRYTSQTCTKVCECCKSSICVIMTPRNFQKLASLVLPIWGSHHPTTVFCTVFRGPRNKIVDHYIFQSSSPCGPLNFAGPFVALDTHDPTRCTCCQNIIW